MSTLSFKTAVRVLTYRFVFFHDPLRPPFLYHPLPSDCVVAFAVYFVLRSYTPIRRPHPLSAMVVHPLSSSTLPYRPIAAYYVPSPLWTSTTSTSANGMSHCAPPQLSPPRERLRVVRSSSSSSSRRFVYGVRVDAVTSKSNSGLRRTREDKGNGNGRWLGDVGVVVGQNGVWWWWWWCGY